MIPRDCQKIAAAMYLLFGLWSFPTQIIGKEFPRYCLTITPDLRNRERVSVIDLVIQNGTVVRVPRFPPGWEIKIQDQIEGSSVIFGGAMGSVAELGIEDLKCLFEIENDVPGTPPVVVKGSIYINNNEHERRVILGKRQLLLETVGDK